MLRVHLFPKMHRGRVYPILDIPVTVWYGTLIAVGYFDSKFRGDGWACALETMRHQLANWPVGQLAHTISKQATHRKDPLLVLRFMEFGTFGNLLTYLDLETLLRGPIARMHDHSIKVSTLLIQFITTESYPHTFLVNVTNCVLAWVPIHDWSVVYIMFDESKHKYLMITAGDVQSVRTRVELLGLEALRMDVCKHTSMPSSHMTLHVRIVTYAELFRLYQPPSTWSTLDFTLSILWFHAPDVLGIS